MNVLARYVERVRQQPRRRIVFPEGEDPRVVTAARQLAREGLLEPVLLGAHAVDGVAVVNPETSPEAARYAALYGERRPGKVTHAEAARIARRPLYFAALMVAAGDAHGTVGGASNPTAETARAALHAIGPMPGVRTVSGFFLLALPDGRVFVFADCALVVEPTAEQLADIAIATAASAETLLETKPVLAMLSFSTKGSARHHPEDRGARATGIVRRRAPELEVDGELQADAALVASIGRSKSPDSLVPGRANTLIFPNLNSANIGYKLAEWMSGATAVGPLLQGLAKPANDLSRACTAEEVYSVAVITALQASGASAGCS
jgi:phosphate acetyltransferase